MDRSQPDKAPSALVERLEVTVTSQSIEQHPEGLSWIAAFAKVRPSHIIAIIWVCVTVMNISMSLVGLWNPSSTARVFGSSLFGIAISIGLYITLKRRLEADRKISLQRVLALAVASGSMMWIIDTLTQAWSGGFRFEPSKIISNSFRLRYSFVYVNIQFVLQALVQVAAFALLRSERTLQARERQLLESRLAALRLQLNPHFLFNSLNALSTLVAEARAAEAEEMIARLSDFLRASLIKEPTDLVPLEEEFDIIQAYLSIEAVRYGDRFIIEYFCEPCLSKAQVPSLILQPLVENAVKFAVAPSKETVKLTVSARAKADYLLLAVQDDGRHAPTGTLNIGWGVGLSNVAARLDALYGADGLIEATKNDRGFAAMIRLPLRLTSG